MNKTSFWSPARRGRGILVAPGFCPAAGVWHPSSRFLVGAKTLKLLVNFFGNFNMTFLATWGYGSDFFKDATKIQNGRKRSTSKKFVGAKTQNGRYGSTSIFSESEITQILLSHSPPYGDVQVTFSRFYWKSKWPPWINFNFLVGAGTQKII